MTKFEVWKRKMARQTKKRTEEQERLSKFLRRASEALQADYKHSRQ